MHRQAAHAAIDGRIEYQVGVAASLLNHILEHDQVVPQVAEVCAQMAPAGSQDHGLVEAHNLNEHVRPESVDLVEDVNQPLFHISLLFVDLLLLLEQGLLREVGLLLDLAKVRELAFAALH